MNPVPRMREDALSGGSIAACRTCGLIQRVRPLTARSVAECARCGSVVVKAKPDSLRRTAALSVAALCFYVPANIYPIMRMEFHGVYTESTVWDGCLRLFHDGQWFVAVIVFLASLLIPLLKLLGLFFLVITTKLKLRRAQAARARLYKIIAMMGPWAMLDVFLLAILVALVKLGRVANVSPGPGVPAFVSLVVLTLLASASFDVRQIWEPSDRSE